MPGGEATQADFIDQTGLKRQYEREQVVGFGYEQAKGAARQDTIAVTIGSSLGAKAKRQAALNPITGEYVDLAEGTHITQPKNHIMAGVGRERQVDCLDYLLDKFGGSTVEWIKEKGFGYVLDEDGDLRQVELHWHQDHRRRRVDMKIKDKDGRIYLDD